MKEQDKFKDVKYDSDLSTEDFSNSDSSSSSDDESTSQKRRRKKFI